MARWYATRRSPYRRRRYGHRSRRPARHRVAPLFWAALAVAVLVALVVVMR
jgi:hypothetical protein